MQKPKDFIRQASLLSQKYIFIETPVIDSIETKEFYGIFSHEHVCIFSVNSLIQLMKFCGYKPTALSINFLEPQSDRKYPTLLSLWEKGSPALSDNIFNSSCILDSYFNHFAQITDKINSQLTNIQSHKIAVWGTGTHTAKIIGMTKIPLGRLVKFYDSDPKKHGKSLLNKPITPFLPEDVSNGTVDTILISSFASESEIRDEINSSGANVNIITIYDKNRTS